MKKIFAEFINNLKDDKAVLLIGDVGADLFHPSVVKVFNVGICEQSMIGMAAGMAMQGFIPYVYTIKSFLLERAFEQIKMDIDYVGLNVKLIGGNSDYGYSHECLDEERLTNCFLNAHCYFPDKDDLMDTFKFVHENTNPCYVSLS